MKPRHARAADKAYVVGQVYILTAAEERSAASHRHFFSAVNEAFANLPDGHGFASPNHLRKAALIRAGYRDERSVVCGSKAEAQRIAAFIRPMDEYAVVSVSGCSVVVLTAKSQDMRSMGKAVFEASKTAVLEILADMIDVAPAELERAVA